MNDESSMTRREALIGSAAPFVLPIPDREYSSESIPPFVQELIGPGGLMECDRKGLMKQVFTPRRCPGRKIGVQLNDNAGANSRYLQGCRIELRDQLQDAWILSQIARYVATRSGAYQIIIILGFV
jgi:hypothetical protein